MVNKWHIIGKIQSSTYRTKILEALAHKELTPKDLENKTNIKASHISRTLRELEKLGLVECLTPELRKNKIFSLTKEGKDILKKL